MMTRFGKTILERGLPENPSLDLIVYFLRQVSGAVESASLGRMDRPYTSWEEREMLVEDLRHIATVIEEKRYSKTE